MTTISAATAAVVAFGLISARVARRAFLRYRGDQHINALLWPADRPVFDDPASEARFTDALRQAAQRRRSPR